MAFLDIRPPKPAEESFTYVKTKAMLIFTRIVATAAIGSQLGVYAILPENMQKPVSTGLLAVGLLAVAAGNEKQGSAIIQDRLGKRDVWTKDGKPGANQDEALYQAFLTKDQKQLVETAVSKHLEPKEIEAPTLSSDDLKTISNTIKESIGSPQPPSRPRIVDPAWEAPV
jgi:hypothetical protein